MNKTPPQCSLCPTLHLSVFKDFEPKSFLQLKKNQRSKVYKKGQIIFHEGHPAHVFYCINLGKASLYKTTSDGKRHIMRIANPGDPMGHLALFSNQPYSATAETLEDTLVCYFDRNLIYPLLSENADVTWSIVQRLTKELISTQNKTLDMANKSVRERVASLLLLLKEKYGKSSDNGILLDICLSREDMADLAGTSMETLVRTLSDFRSDKLIVTKKRQIYISFPEKLAMIAGFQD
ncbi:MAG: Crp/Fnr family transcriptional regulator [Candidatus Marinimicrobia bacterium]|nr:Crp/Fnr family transcriptional regulator [Candidatus Neomarinimicrobiota bacterium]